MTKRRGNQEGTIYQRKSGTWLAQVSIQGKRVSKSFPTQKESRLWIKKMLEQVESGLNATGARMIFGTYLKTWLENARGTIRPKTWQQYEGIVRNHLAPALGSIRLSELQPNHIQNLYGQMLKHGHSPRTMQLIHSVLRRALVIAQRQGLIGRNPAKVVDPPRYAKGEMKVFTDTQARQLLITARGMRNEALYHLAVTTGMRQGELLGLKWKDIDWSTCTIHVQRQAQRINGMGIIFSETKTRSGNRMIQFGQETLKLLAAHLKRQDLERKVEGWRENDLIFPSTIGTPLEQRNFYREFKELLKVAGLPDIRFHDLRHTAATLMLLNGIPLLVVSRRLGHAKPSITLDVYGHYLPGMQSEAAALMDELVTPIAAELQQPSQHLATRGPLNSTGGGHLTLHRHPQVIHQGLEP
ncbi:MAG TPA: site-specific integrase [Anaerolineaceae bacterium]